jgi:hypothetical protein
MYIHDTIFGKMGDTVHHFVTCWHHRHPPKLNRFNATSIRQIWQRRTMNFYRGRLKILNSLLELWIWQRFNFKWCVNRSARLWSISYKLSFFIGTLFCYSFTRALHCTCCTSDSITSCPRDLYSVVDSAFFLVTDIFCVYDFREVSLLCPDTFIICLLAIPHSSIIVMLVARFEWFE